MTPQRWEHVKRLFHAALDRAAEDRPRFVAEACGGDADLDGQVHLLLQQYDESGSFMETLGPHALPGGLAAMDTLPTPGPDPTRAGSPAEAAGTQIGRFKLLRLLGEGGFGSVWLAEQNEPVRRRTALKIIKLGMDTRQVIARFEAERQALAVMDHPHVAKVFDAGSTETGRPYFVMEYVQGVPITEHCDRHKLSVRERLELFIQVCEAVQHAHQKGIIHRDIKPSNILVEIGNAASAKGNPKVIDFGIAKAITSPLTNMTLYTEQGQLIGTPAYMSPEQADLSAQDIDTRSDIYSLGVLLYELLTGTLPFDPSSLGTGGLAEMQRLIRDVEPPRPSTKVSNISAAENDTSDDAIAIRRRSNPGTLRKLIRGDLDWITMKALEKDRTRRYASASDLAADIQRHLADEPVLARPPSVRYRLQKFVRRNGSAVAAGIFAVSFVIGISIAFAVFQSNQTERFRQIAQSEATAKDEAVAAKREADTQRDAAVSAEKLAKEERDRAQSVTNFIVKSLQSQDLFAEGQNESSVADALTQAVAGIQAGALADQPATEALLLRTICRVLTRNARPEQAKAHAQRALALEQQLHPGDHVDVAKSLVCLANVLGACGKLAEAKVLFQRAEEMHNRLFENDHPDVLDGLFGLAGVYFSLGQPADAEPLCVRALDMSRRLHPDGDHPSVAKCLHDLALVRDALGRAAEAEPLHAQAVAMSRRLFQGDHPHLARALRNLARCLAVLDRLPEALERAQESAAMAARVLPAGHPVRDECEAMHIQIAGAALNARARECWQLLVEQRWEELAAVSNDALRSQVNERSVAQLWTQQSQLLGAYQAIESSQVVNLSVVQFTCRFEKARAIILIGFDGEKLGGIQFAEYRTAEEAKPASAPSIEKGGG